MKKGFVLLLLLCSVVFASTALTAPVVLKVAYTNVDEHPQGESFMLFKKLVEERAGGSIKVELYGNGKLGWFDAIMQGLQMGVVAIGGESPSNYSVYEPKLMLLDLPYLIPSFDAAAKLLDGPIGQDLAKSLESKGIFLLGYMHMGYRTIFSSTPIRKLEDASGLKIRTTPSKVEIATIKSFGMNPTPLVWGEVYTALQQKTVDGINIDINLAYVNKFHEVCKYVTLTNNNYFPLMIFMSKKYWNTLDPTQQDIVKKSFDESLAFERKRIQENIELFTKEMQKAGVEVITLPPDEMARWHKAAAPVGPAFYQAVPEDLQNRARAVVAQ